MIRCDIRIEYMKGEQTGLSIAVEPDPSKADHGERVVWTFFETIIQCAFARISEQMAENSNRSELLRVELESRAIYDERIKRLGCGQRLTASFQISFSPAFGMAYFLIHQPDQGTESLEALAWKTFKAALDVGTDFFSSDDFGTDYEQDQRAMKEHIEEELGKLPIFPRVE